MADLVVEYVAAEASESDLVELLEGRGYRVEVFAHGLHLPGDPVRFGYRVRGHGVESVGDVGLLLELVASHADRVAAAELVQAEQRVESDLRLRLAQLLEQLEPAGRLWPGLSAAQKDAAMRRSVQATAALVRLRLRWLDRVGD